MRSMEDFTERFKTLVGNDRTGFSYKTLVSYTTVTNIMNGAEPRVGLLLKVFDAFPGLSAEWLIKGEGEMYLNEKKESSEPSEEPAEVKGLKAELSKLQSQYDLLRSMYDDKCAELAETRKKL